MLIILVIITITDHMQIYKKRNADLQYSALYYYMRNFRNLIGLE